MLLAHRASHLSSIICGSNPAPRDRASPSRGFAKVETTLPRSTGSEFQLAEARGSLSRGRSRSRFEGVRPENPLSALSESAISTFRPRGAPRRPRRAPRDPETGKVLISLAREAPRGEPPGTARSGCAVPVQRTRVRAGKKLLALSNPNTLPPRNASGTPITQAKVEKATEGDRKSGGRPTRCARPTPPRSARSPRCVRSTSA